MIGYHPAASQAAVVTVAISRRSMRSGHAAGVFVRAGEATAATGPGDTIEQCEPTGDAVRTRARPGPPPKTARRGPVAES